MDAYCGQRSAVGLESPARCSRGQRVASVSTIRLCLVLPEPKDGPSVFPIAGDLGGPKIRIAFGCCAVVGASVPEASIHEDRYPGAGEHQIRSEAPIIWQRRVVNPIAESRGVDHPADGQFGLSVPSPVGNHAGPYPGA